LKAIFSVLWFSEWNDTLEDALNDLPEMSGCPHILYKSLIQNDASYNKKIALILMKDVPVALIGLRKREDNWVTVTHYLLPDCLFPMREEYLSLILDTLDINLWISWWRNRTPIPKSRYIICMEKIPTYVADLSRGHEKYWSNNHLRHVKRARHSCREFTSAVNPPGAAKWIITNCEMKWNAGANLTRDNLSDQLLVANYLENINRHYAVVLMDKGNYIGGLTSIVHKDDVVATHIYRSPGYEKQSIGTYLIDLSLSWAKESGYKEFDMGGDYSDYKKHWAPSAGEKINVHVCKSYFTPVQYVKIALTNAQTTLRSIYKTRQRRVS
jgi:hypothetical protein